MGTSNSALIKEDNIKRFIDDSKSAYDDVMKSVDPGPQAAKAASRVAHKDAIEKRKTVIKKYKDQIGIYSVFIKDLENDEEFSKSYETLLDRYLTLTTSIPRPSPVEKFNPIDDIYQEMNKYFYSFVKEIEEGKPPKKGADIPAYIWYLKSEGNEFTGIDKLDELKKLKYLGLFILLLQENEETKNKIIFLTPAEEDDILKNIKKIDAKIKSSKQGFKKFKSTHKSKKSNKKIKKSQKKSYRKVKKSVKSIKKRNIKH
jgi:hypothetical protein